MNDPGFLDRVYRTGLVVWAIGIIIILARVGAGSASGWTAGCAFSFAVLAAIEWFVRKCFVPGNDKAGSTFTLFAFLKMPALLILLAGAIFLGKDIEGFIWAFCAGVGLVQVVIILKVVGSAVNGRINPDKQ